MFLLLTAIPSCLSNNPTISVFPFIEARFNAESLNFGKKFHKWFKISISYKN